MKNKKLIAVICCLALLVGAAGATLAWLMDKTDEVTNTFTTSDIDIELNETTGKEYQMIPGFTIDKDPLVTINAESEDCWVFIEVKETGGNVTVYGKTYTFDDFISYDIDPNNWTQLSTDKEGNALTGVYYCKATDVTTDCIIKVLGYTDTKGVYHNNKVLIKDTVTKEMMNAINDNNKPTLSFKAYAHQLYKNENLEEFTPAEAWANLNK